MELARKVKTNNRVLEMDIKYALLLNFVVMFCFISTILFCDSPQAINDAGSEIHTDRHRLTLCIHKPQDLCVITPRFKVLDEHLRCGTHQ